MNTTIQLARDAAAAALAESGLYGVAIFQIEDVDTNHAPYLGVCVTCDFNEDVGVHVYLCDDEPSNPVWMVDPSNFATGEVDPQPLTPETLQAALRRLVA